MIARRLPVVVVLVALIAAALTLDPRRPEPATTSTAVAAATLSPLATAVDAGSSTWFCAGGSATVTGVAEHVITIANPTDAAAGGTLQLFLEGQDPQAFPVAVAAFDQTRVPLAALAQGEWAAALVELDRGGVVVSHEVLGIGGWDSDRCSSQASDHWYLPWGQTAPQEASSLRLALFNPFAVEAVVDIAFDTDDGFRTPEALQGFLVPPRRLVTVDVTNIVPVRLRVSTEVVARSGRLVVSRLQSLSGIDGTVTLDVTPAAPAAATSWYFADGRVDADTLERIAVYNPGEQTAQVEVEVTRARLTRDLAIEPFGLQIPPQSYAEVVLNDESRVPEPLRHTTVVRSLNDVPVVAERVQLSSTVKQATATAIEEAATSATATTGAGEAAPDTATTVADGAPPDQAAPAQDAVAAGLVPLPPGLSATLGTPVVARSWVLPDAGRPDVSAAKIVVTNVSNDQPATFTVRLYRGGSPLSTTPTTAPTEPPTTEPPTTEPPTTEPPTTAPPTTDPTATPTTAAPTTAAPATTPVVTTTAPAVTSTTPAPADDGPAPTALEPRQQVEIPVVVGPDEPPVLAVIEATGMIAVDGVQIYGPVADVSIRPAVARTEGVRVPDPLDPDIGIGEEPPTTAGGERGDAPGATTSSSGPAEPTVTSAPAPAGSPLTTATTVATTAATTPVPATEPAPTPAPPADAPPATPVEPADPTATTAPAG